MVFLEEFNGLSDDVAATAGAGRRPPRLHAHHPIVTDEAVILGAQLLGMEIHRLQDVDDGRRQLLGQGEGRIVLRIATNLQDSLAKL